LNVSSSRRLKIKSPQLSIGSSRAEKSARADLASCQGSEERQAAVEPVEQTPLKCVDAEEKSLTGDEDGDEDPFDFSASMSLGSQKSEETEQVFYKIHSVSKISFKFFSVKFVPKMCHNRTRSAARNVTTDFADRVGKGGFFYDFFVK